MGKTFKPPLTLTESMKQLDEAFAADLINTDQYCKKRKSLHKGWRGYKDLLKPNDNEQDWTIAEMEQAVINGYLLYYWAIYYNTEQDRRAA